MKKHTYRSKNINKINVAQIQERLAKEPAFFAIDIAKEKQYGLLSNTSGGVSELIWWNHPEQTVELLSALKALECPIDIVIELTGTYGDALRFHFRQCDFNIYQMNAKRVKDASEIYDGVPSMHDAKSATLITHLHREGLSKPWVELTDDERTMSALLLDYAFSSRMTR